MAGFTDTVSDVDAPKRSTTGDAASSSLAGLAKLASTALPLVQRHLDKKTDANLEDASDKFLKEFETLGAKVKQGKMSEADALSAASTKLKTLSSNDPRQAAMLRERVQKRFNINVGQMRAEDAATEMGAQKEAQEQLYNLAAQKGYVLKDANGQIDFEKSVDLYIDTTRAQAKNAALKANTTLTKEKTTDELFNNITIAANGTQQIVQDRIDAVYADTTLSSAEQEASAKQIYAEERAAFLKLNIVEGLAGHNIGITNYNNIKNTTEAIWDSMEVSQFDENKGTRKLALRSRKAIMEATDNNIISANATFISLSNNVHSDVMAGVITRFKFNSLVDAGTGAGMMSQLQKTMQNTKTMEMASKSMSGHLNPSAQGPEDQRILGRMGSHILNDSTKTIPTLAEKQKTPALYRSYIINADANITALALNSGKMEEIRGALDRLAKPAMFGILKEGKKTAPENNERLYELTGNMRTASDKYISDLRGRAMSELKDELGGRGNIAYNPATGRVELSLDKNAFTAAAQEQTKGGSRNLSEQEVSDRTQARISAFKTKVAPMLKGVNNALMVYGNASQLQYGNEQTTPSQFAFDLARERGFEITGRANPTMPKEVQDAKPSTTAPEPETYRYQIIDGKAVRVK